eukprot:3214047-Pleurochrysis_carterae.AAC.1
MEDRAGQTRENTGRREGVTRACLVGADGAEARVLARGARVWLERHAGEAGDLAEQLLERADELGVAATRE